MFVGINIMKAESHEIKLQTFNSGKTAISQPVLPVIKINDKCPLGFQSSNGYCIPNNSRVQGVISIYPGIKTNGCPMGFRENNGYCQLFEGVEKFALPKVGNLCPRGFISNGDYCIK